MTTTKIITKAQFVANYHEAEKRAATCAKGKAFTVEDRLTLNAQRKQLNLDYAQASALFDGVAGQGKHYNRFQQWDAQIRSGLIRTAPSATGEHVGTPRSTVKVNHEFFDGRIKSHADIQPAFNRAARQLIKVGITNPQEAFKYVSNAFEMVKVEQKIDTKAERILNELRMGDLTKEQVLMTLEKVKQQF